MNELYHGDQIQMGQHVGVYLVVYSPAEKGQWHNQVVTLERDSSNYVLWPGAEYVKLEKPEFTVGGEVEVTALGHSPAKLSRYGQRGRVSEINPDGIYIKVLFPGMDYAISFLWGELTPLKGVTHA